MRTQILQLYLWRREVTVDYWSLRFVQKRILLSQHRTDLNDGKKYRLQDFYNFFYLHV